MPAPTATLRVNMNRHRRAVLFASASVLAACGGGNSNAPAPGPAPPPFVFPTPDPTTRVSGTAAFAAGCDGGTVVNNGTLYLEAEVEPTVALDPSNPGRMIGTWQQNRWSAGASQGIGVAYSADGGATWTRSRAPLSRCTGGTPGNGGNYERVSDPWVAISSDGGTAYLMALAIGSAATTSAMLVSRSIDHGQMWSDPTSLILDGTAFFNDKNSITADPLIAANAYAVWDRPGAGNNGPTIFTRTIDDGVTWSQARAIYDPGSNAQTLGNVIVVTSNGTLVNIATRIVPSGSRRVADLIAMRSTDQGATWTPPIKINDLLAVGAFDPHTRAAIRDGSDLPQAAAGPNGEIYVVWQDARGTNGQIDAVLLSKSIDGGITWSPPVRVNTQATVQAFTPRVHVRSDGAVAVSYFDTRNDTSDPTSLPTDYWLVRSTDGAATWSEAHIAGPFDLALAPNALGLFLGDYQGLTSSATGFLSFFVQTTRDGAANRTDVFRQDVPLTGPGPIDAKVQAPAALPVAQPNASFRARVSARIELVRAGRGRPAP